MYRVVHYHLIWAVVSATGAVAALLAVEAVRGFDAPFGADANPYLVSWAVVSGLYTFYPGPMVGSRAETKRAQPMAPGTLLPPTRTSLARAAVWKFLPLPIVVGFLLGFVFDTGMALFLACAMTPESLLAALRLAVRERRTGRVYWCGSGPGEEPDEEPAEVPDAGDKDPVRPRRKAGARHPLWWSPRLSTASGKVSERGADLA